MRRILLALASTAVGLVMLLSYKTPDPSRADELRPAAFGPPLPGATTTTLRAARTTKARAARTTTTTGIAAETASTRVSTTTRRAATTTTRAAAATKQVTGPVVNNEYGPVQVRVTVQGTRILDVVALQLPSSKERSREISNRAGPLLRQRVLAAQSAQIDAVSGATFTSRSYVGSLQAALDSV